MDHNRYRSPKIINPFAFPTETDARYLLLVLIVSGTLLSLGSFYSNFWTLNVVWSLVVGISLNIFVFFWAWRSAKKYAIIKIKEEQWTHFPPNTTNQRKKASLNKMNAYIQDILGKTTNGDQKLEIFWDDKSEARVFPTGIAFGFGKNQYIGLRQGLESAFNRMPTYDTFNIVFLHELSHVVNKDVSKTIFSLVLKRCFFITMLASILLFDLTFIWHHLRFPNPAGNYEAVRLLINLNWKILIILFLIDFVQRSILRVREYYADARAFLWFGKIRPFLQLFAQDENTKTHKFIISGKNLLNVKSLYEVVMTYIAPRHPENSTRAKKLTNLAELFQSSYEVIFLAGILVGLSLNSNALLYSLIFEGGQILEFLNQLVQGSNDPQTVRLFANLFFIVEFTLYAGLIGVTVIFAILPITNSIGLDIQKSSTILWLNISNAPNLSTLSLAKFSLIIGTGIVIGGWLSPVDHFLSLSGFSYLGIPLYIIGWAFILFLWMLPLRYISGYVLSHHFGRKQPDRKRKVITLISALTLIPLFLAAGFFQASLSALLAFPEDFLGSIFQIFEMIIGISIFAGLFPWFLWTGAQIFFFFVGWTRNSKCPNCQLKITGKQSSLLNGICPGCNSNLTSWLFAEDPIRLPSLPRNVVPLSKSAPPLSTFHN